MHVACAEMKSVLTGVFVFSVLVCEARIEYQTVPAVIERITTWYPTVISKTCTLIPDKGPCRANIMMYFYDPASQSCDTFEWGGCMGNGNRFETRAECNITCLSQPTTKSKAPRWCQLTFDYGFCFGQVERYYYDRFWRVCKPALYSGCGGNRNNFYSLEQCEQICRFGKEMLGTTRNTSGKKKVLYINPRTTARYAPTTSTDKTTIGPKF